MNTSGDYNFPQKKYVRVSSSSPKEKTAEQSANWNQKGIDILNWVNFSIQKNIPIVYVYSRIEFYTCVISKTFITTMKTLQWNE
jgi:hypothetical protein